MSFTSAVKKASMLILALLSVYQVNASTLEEDSLRQELFKNRLSIHTNTLDWLFVIPNIGLEFDFANSEENYRSILIQGRYNWNTNHLFKPRNVFDVAGVSVEYRKYWRTGSRLAQNFPKYKERDTTISRVRWFFKKMRRNVWSGRTVTHPRIRRAYYIGLYAGYDQYSLAIKGKGIEGKSVDIGVSGGWSIPLILFAKGQSLDLDLGLTVGAQFTKWDRYRYLPEENRYENYEHKGMHVTPFPMIHQVRVGLAYRFRSISRKVHGGDKRYQQRDQIQDEKRALRIKEQDSLYYARQTMKLAEKQAEESEKLAKKQAKEARKVEKQMAKKSGKQAKVKTDTTEKKPGKRKLGRNHSKGKNDKND